MESVQDIERINLAIQKLLEEKRIHDTTSGNKLSEDDDDQLLSRLLSQLETLKGDSELKQASNLLEEVSSPTPRVDKRNAESENGNKVESMEEIMKEIKAVKKQNTITHCLLSVMIVVTLTWQLSEGFLFLKVKNGFANPFRTIGNFVSGMLRFNIQQDADNNFTSTPNHNSNHFLDPAVKLPEIPRLELPLLGSNGDGH
ncbi:hypothetical protein CCACVL1_24081 [Corchorus capsularis]|uniref:Uncharacterized protein n=1 Tax=Corchorus capsularis TaxID=210143 RepID=A0A1R3GR35_COCAP|nr:hypothetical protein CCACVL1_24081 [Corchorus capsularis]